MFHISQFNASTIRETVPRTQIDLDNIEIEIPNSYATRSVKELDATPTTTFPFLLYCRFRADRRPSTPQKLRTQRLTTSATKHNELKAPPLPPKVFIFIQEFPESLDWIDVSDTELDKEPSLAYAHIDPPFVITTPIHWQVQSSGSKIRALRTLKAIRKQIATGNRSVHALVTRPSDSPYAPTACLSNEQYAACMDIDRPMARPKVKVLEGEVEV